MFKKDTTFWIQQLVPMHFDKKNLTHFLLNATCSRNFELSEHSDHRTVNKKAGSLSNRNFSEAFTKYEKLLIIEPCSEEQQEMFRDL